MIQCIHNYFRKEKGKYFIAIKETLKPNKQQKEGMAMKSTVYVSIGVNINGEFQQINIPADHFKEIIEQSHIDKDTEAIQLIFNINNQNVHVHMKLSDVRKLIKRAELYFNIIPNGLSGYLTDITQKMSQRNRVPLVGRDDEIEKAWFYLTQEARNNVFLTGDLEVGKTAIAMELIRQISTNECPEEFYEKRVIKLDPEAILRAEALDRSEYKEKYVKSLKKLIEFLVKYRKSIVLYIDDAIYMKTDEALIDILYKLIKSFKVPLIMVTSSENYNDYFLDDFVISKYVNEVYVEEAEFKEIEPMLKHFVKKIQREYGITISDEMVKFAIYTAVLSNSPSANPGLSKNVLKKAFVEAKRKGKTEVDKESILSCYELNKKLGKVWTEKARRTTAYHEAGHYIAHVKCQHACNRTKVAFVSILPASYYLGVNWFYYNLEDDADPSKDYYIDEIACDMAGRIAEMRVTNSYDAGAEADLSYANAVAREGIMRYGLSDSKGNTNRSYDYEDYYLLPESKKELLDLERSKWINEGYNRAEKIISENEELLTIIAERLLKDEILTGEELEKICTDYEKEKETK